jgi:hypothetical protein
VFSSGFLVLEEVHRGRGAFLASCTAFPGRSMHHFPRPAVKHSLSRCTIADDGALVLLSPAGMMFKSALEDKHVQTRSPTPAACCPPARCWTSVIPTHSDWMCCGETTHPTRGNVPQRRPSAAVCRWSLAAVVQSSRLQAPDDPSTFDRCVESCTWRNRSNIIVDAALSSSKSHHCNRRRKGSAARRLLGSCTSDKRTRDTVS